MKKFGFEEIIFFLNWQDFLKLNLNKCLEIIHNLLNWRLRAENYETHRKSDRGLLIK